MHSLVQNQLRSGRHDRARSREQEAPPRGIQGGPAADAGPRQDEPDDVVADVSAVQEGAAGEQEGEEPATEAGRGLVRGVECV